MPSTNTLAQLAQVLEDCADRATVQNFAEFRRMLRRRLSTEGLDYRPVWKATVMDFQDGCRELAHDLRAEAQRYELRF
ncbi:MAG TPA: hypothetical protein VFL69_14580 [Marmoricola sp.]|jgi:hypothetical protein|nr:hypothetical protein [Marmoricola sp.]